MTETLTRAFPPSLYYDFPFVKRGSFISECTPWDIFDRIIAEAPPIFRVPNLSEKGEGWVVNNGPKIAELLANSIHLSTKSKLSIREASKRGICPIPSVSDPPAHSFYRGVVSPMFAVKRFSDKDGDIRMIARKSITGLADRGGCEFMADFAFKFPIKIFLLMMGLPVEMTSQFLAWEHQVMRGADIQEVGKAIDEVCDYLEEQIADRRRNPRDDLITYGIHAEYRGRRLNEDELLGYCFALFGGGLDTVSASMTHHFIHLAKHQDQQRVLRENPALIEGALDDMLRAYGPVVQVRECVKPLEVLGQEIVPGERVCLPTPIANRDPRLFDSPAAVRFDRNPRHYTFGVGPHACVGLHLARREMRIGIEEFLSAIPQFRLNPDEPLIYNLGGLVLQPVATHLLWN